MRCYIQYLGVVDKLGNSHYISLEEGLNVITGRSSTGKSAIIEIFDYCTGSHTNTIPVGVITENAKLYFVVLSTGKTKLVMARTQGENSTKAFYKVDPDVKIEKLTADYFEEEYFVQLKNFLIELEHFCGLDVSDTDETIDWQQKKGRPSFRNMVSYMLQPQHLIANKYALFYRFDEKEKRERVIEEFKIFSGIVDQQYFTLCQELADKRKLLENYEREEARHKEEKARRAEELDFTRQNYACISGMELFPGVSSEQILSAPQQYLDQLEQYAVKVNEESEEYKEQYKKLWKDKNALLAKKRKLVVKLEQIEYSIHYANQYAEMMDNYTPVKEAITEDSECPFCHSKTNSTRLEANRLTEAIQWLNKELRNSKYRIDSFLPQKRSVENEIGDINKNIEAIDYRLRELYKINERLEKNQSLENQTLKCTLQVQNILEWAVESMLRYDTKKIDALNNEIKSIQALLDKKYNVENELKKAESFINDTMNKIGNRLAFEKSYQPINLRFDIHTFELYHQVSEKEKVYLRSMGSGANWLYSHICLFLALLRYFAETKSSTIPSILFIDQPSQVYFPAVDTNRKEFNAEELKKGETELDDDMSAVTNLYTQIALVIEAIYKNCGYRPQIIISDHADKLNLNGFDFESFIRARWRKSDDGLINVKIIEEQQKQA